MIPELLCPAGTPEKLNAALRYGADAVYLAGEAFGMRAAAGNFTLDQLREGVKTANSYGKKIYLTVNVMPHDDEYKALAEYFDAIRDIGISALIVADLGVISLAKEILPDMELHVSTQASVVSARTCEEFLRLGCRRVVLARELTLEEIRRIRREASKEVELEAFVHGSMCISYSGRCLLSNYFTGRDANRGKCAQPCRWNFKLYETAEEKRLGDRLPVEETDLGTFIMSSRDMCMIEHIPELCEVGLDSLKIEGRMKSVYYTAVTANAYRMALDSYAKDPAGYVFDPIWKEELESVSHREYATGFYFDRPEVDAKTVVSMGYVRDKAYLARVLSYDAETGRATFELRNKLSIGDKVELISPGKAGRGFTVSDIMNEAGEQIESAPHPLMKFSLPVPFEAKCGDILRSGNE